MALDDISAVMKVELSVYPFPWTEGIFRDCLSHGHFCRLLEHEGDIAGYVVMSMAVGEAHILNICVRPDLRGRGLGRGLLRATEEEALLNEVELMLLEVRPSNLPAVNLYESMGFNEIGRRRDYYPAAGGREDALVMARQLKL